MTTKRRKRPNQQLGALKTLLVVGSMAATLAGTRLLAMQDTQDTAVSQTAPVIVVVPATQMQQTTYPLPPTMNGDGRGTAVQLQPIPQAVTPNIQVRPVAQSRSSR
ncbi:MAG: hypothetical protein KC415_13200 [Anaerolineales bacterium]|nr:hypothetical protein [Anaerolineales bacterium]MCB8990074.1 hypothetical protein [Ardenticatenaceae bacterium]